MGREATVADEDGQPPLRVGWVGPSPAWLEQGEVAAELEGIELEQSDAGQPFVRDPHVVHVIGSALGELGGLKQAHPDSTLVLDLTGEGETALGRSQARQAGRADVVLAGSRWELGELHRRIPALRAHTSVVERPVDLDWFAPEPRLAEAKGRGRDLRLFRRFHRLAGPVVLFAGPYTDSGGLDLVLEAVFRLRERRPDLRLAAIPHGPTDERFRDRCEMRALALGHHGIVEWEPVESQIPFWYATAAVVCAPGREAGSPEPAKRAAAAGRPFVGSDLGASNSLDSSLEALLEDPDEATQLGEAARLRAEADYSPVAAARSLKREWDNARGAPRTLPATAPAARGGTAPVAGPSPAGR